MKKKKIKYVFLAGIFLLIILSSLFSAALSGTYSRYNPQYSPPASSADYLRKQGINLYSWDETKCEAGQDFVLQINPAGCTPKVVPEDLLEDQNVPVFCPITATQVNPLIDVNSIKRLRISSQGRQPKEISGIGFHPARAALRSRESLLNSPILDNVGYAVIVLKKQKNESAILKWIEGNLSVKIDYDIENAFGIGKGIFYLPELDEKEWGESYKLYGFLQNKFYLRAESIGLNDAIIGIYTGENLKYKSIRLEKGKASDLIFLPGFYCMSGVELKLETLDNPGTRIKLNVGDDVVELVEGERFFDNKCNVRKIEKDKVKIFCSTDEGGKDIYLSGFVNRIGNEKTWQDYYDESIKYYQQVADDYPSEKQIGDGYYGERALSEAYELADINNKDEDKQKIEEKYNKIYGNVLPYFSVKDSRIVMIEGELKTISLLEITQSGFEDYGVELRIDNSDIIKLEKSQIHSDGDVSVELISLTREYAQIKIKIGDKSTTLNIRENEIKTYQNHKFIVNKIHLTKIAKVSVKPDIKRAETESVLHYKIGIDKRAIKLSPEKTKDMIKNLNETIEKLEKMSDNLGKVVKGMKGACLATGGVITVKNLFSGFSGEAIARQYTMRGIDGKGGVVNLYCSQKITQTKEFKTLAECLADSETKKIIEQTQNTNEQVLKEQNARLETFRTSCILKSEWFGEEYVNDICFCEKQKTLMQNPLNFDLSKIDCNTVSPRMLRELEYYQIVSKYSGQSGGIFKDSQTLADEIYRKITETKTTTQTQNQPVEGAIGPEYQKVKYFKSAPNENVPAIVPIMDPNKGWYVGVKSSLSGSVHESGRLKLFYLCNAGGDNAINFVPETGSRGGDYCQLFDDNFGVPQGLKLPGKNEQETRDLFYDARRAFYDALSNYKAGNKEVMVLNNKLMVETIANIPQTQCEDFMSPDDCKILFNICDPVVCPSSRCNFGGTYYLDDVIQSGIVGSTFACLPNFVGFKGDVVIPVCLSGVHAGINGLLSVYQAHRDCLQHKLETGETIGFCDEIYSIQMCDFFWKQVAPFADIIIPKMLEAATGQFVRGGGEYMSVASAWENAEKSTNYFTQYYAVNAFKMFKAKSITDVGSEMCRNFLSTSYPSGKSFLDALTEPVSPPQFHGWLDSALYTGATLPPTYKYSVFYHIYAGTEKDEVDYLVYMRDPSGRTMTVPNARGKISKGGYKTDKADFIGASGFNELCIVVGTQEECGFGRVSTSFALNYVQDKYVEQQKSEQIDSQEKCISGSHSAYEFINPNLQAGTEGYLNPNLKGLGIVRVCSTGNPGQQTDPNRWKNVGNCGEPNLKCWLDSYSVNNSFSLQRVTENGLESEFEKLQKDFESTYMMTNEFQERIIDLEVEISTAYYKKDSSSLKILIKKIESIEIGKDENGKEVKTVFYPWQRAELLILKARAYKFLTLLSKDKIDEVIDVKGMTCDIEGTCEEFPTCEGGTIVDGECKVGEEEITEEMKKKVDLNYESPVFEFMDGSILSISDNKIFIPNLYYKYEKGKWYWSLNEKEWITISPDDATFVTSEGDEPARKKDRNFIRELSKKSSYEDGLRLLLNRAKANDEGGWFANTKLSTEKVDFNHKGEFIIKGKDVIFQYDDKEKKWKVIKPKPTIKTETKTIDYLITTLVNEKDGKKDFYEGAKIIFKTMHEVSIYAA